MCQSNKSPPQYKKTILAMEGRDRGQLPAPTILLFNFIKSRSRLDARKSLLDVRAVNREWRSFQNGARHI